MILHPKLPGKAHGKGKPLDLVPNANSISKLNTWKNGLANVSEGVPVLEWRPLRSFPAAAHPRQAELDRYRAGAVVIWDGETLLFGRMARG